MALPPLKYCTIESDSIDLNIMVENVDVLFGIAFDIDGNVVRCISMDAGKGIERAKRHF